MIGRKCFGKVYVYTKLGGIKLTEKGGLLNLYFIDKNTSAV
jgi:hypothetical protein